MENLTQTITISIEEYNKLVAAKQIVESLSQVVGYLDHQLMDVQFRTLQKSAINLFKEP